MKLPAPPSQPSEPANDSRLESLLGQLLAEYKRTHSPHHTDFSVARLLAGIVQIIVIAVLLIAYLNTGAVSTQQALLLLAIVLQGVVIAATVAGRK